MVATVASATKTVTTPVRTGIILVPVLDIDSHQIFSAQLNLMQIELLFTSSCSVFRCIKNKFASFATN